MSEEHQRVAPEPADVVERMVEIRERRKQLKKEFEQADQALREKWERGENWLIRHMQEHRVSNLGIANKFTVFTSHTLRASPGDWETLADYIRSSGDVDLLEHRVSSKAVKEYMEVNAGQVPPGVSTSTKVTINIRNKPSK